MFRHIFSILKANQCKTVSIRNFCSAESSGGGKYKVVMVRHGESEWNQSNLFTGWYDANLSKKGIEEAIAAGNTLKELKFVFDEAHTSVLQRAICTLMVILETIEQQDIPIHFTWRLNERHYGALTGLSKSDTAEKYGEDQVKIWRRSFDIPPPPMKDDHKHFKDIVEDRRYSGLNAIDQKDFPMFESLKSTILRTLPYWNDVIVPDIKKGKRLIIAAHGNSLRGIVKHIDNITDNDIMEINLPTGIPFLYEFDENMKPTVSMKFLGNEETVKRAMQAVAAQGKKK